MKNSTKLFLSLAFFSFLFFSSCTEDKIFEEEIQDQDIEFDLRCTNTYSGNSTAYFLSNGYNYQYSLQVTMACDKLSGSYIENNSCVGQLTYVSHVGDMYTYEVSLTGPCSSGCTVKITYQNGYIDWWENCGYGYGLGQLQQI